MKRVLLTGAASGIGKATREELERRGARVAGLDLAESEGLIHCDVSDQGSVDRAVAEAIEQLGGLDVVVRRNAFGRQVDSFEGEIDFAGLDGPVHAVFIRAPWVEQVGPGVEVLARASGGEAAGRIVAVRQGPLMATAFHPEVDGDGRVLRRFADLVATS